MPVRSRPALRRTSWAAAVLVSTPLLLTACSGAGSCDRGAPTVDEALAGFLTAVADGDTAATEAMLVEGATVDAAEFEALRADLEGVLVDDATVQDEQMGSHHLLEVTAAQGRQVGVFEVTESSGCATVAWGNLPAPAEPAPGESQTASTS